MAAETSTHRETPAETPVLGEYVTPSLDFVVVFILTVAIALLGVAVIFP